MDRIVEVGRGDMDRVVEVSRGVKGDRSVSIKNVELNENGHFIVTYDNGEKVDAGLSAFGAAKQYADAAQTSKDAAKISETNAKASETEAAKQAEIATNQTSIAVSKAEISEQSAIAAENSATASATSASSSANSAETASSAKNYIESHYDEIKQDITTTENQITAVRELLSQSEQASTNAQSKAAEAATSASQAAKSAEAAATSATNASNAVKNAVFTENNLDDSIKTKLLGDKNVTGDNIKDGTIGVEKLSFTVDTSGGGATVTTIPWTNITGKPETYTPSTHTHKVSDISDLDLTLYATTAALNGKQDKLAFDDTPTAESSNPVTSAGVKAYVDTAISTITDADTKSY